MISNKFTPFVAIAVLWLVLAHSAVAAPVLIDWSGTGTAAAVTNPAGDGKYWNSLGDAGTGSDLATAGLIDSSGVGTGWSVAVNTTDSATSGEDSGFGGTGVSGPAGADPFDEPNAVVDGIFAQHSAAAVTISFTGLVSSTHYNFSAIGGRAANGRDGLITVMTGSGSGGTLLNDGTVLIFSVTSDGSGTIVLGFAAAPGGSGSQNATLNALSITAPAAPKIISVNFGIALDDSNRVDANESAVTGLNGVTPVAGSGWNNVLLGASGYAAPTVFTAATQGGNHIDLIDSSGSDAGVDLTSSGAFYANFGNVSSPNAALTGDAGLFQSYLLLNSTESVQLKGLSAWATNGYYVRTYFDIGNFTRNYAITMHDGGTPQAFWTADSAATDSDPNNDGAITWKQTTATTEGTAVADANHALFGPFTGDTLTLSGLADTRAALSGLQIVANSYPLPKIVSFTATPALFTAGQSVTLNWQVNDADSVTISPSIGTVAATGSLAVSPSATITWTLTAIRGTTQVTAQATATLNLGPIDVYLLAGQSNMQGTALTADLPSGLLSIPEIQLYAGGTGVSAAIANKWVTLRPANGDKFGPEIGIGEKMRNLCPGQPIALLKHAATGTSLEIGWKPGANATDTANWGPNFTGFVNTMNNGLAALEAKGWQPVIKGMCWQQGEQDAKDGLNAAESTTSADDYGANLKHFVTRVRQQFSTKASPSGIRFVTGQVLPYAPAGGDVVARFPGRSLVRQAILKADEDSGDALSISNTRSIPTNSTSHPVHAQEIPGNTDEVHLGATAQLALGRSMAYAMLYLDPQTYLQWKNSRNVVGGPDDDDDHDGLTNRTEYMFGGIPTNAGSAPRPLLSFTGGGSNPTYTVSRNLEASDLAPKVQFSADLADWTSQTPVFISSVKQADGTAILTYQGPWTVGSHARGFFRTIETAP